MDNIKIILDNGIEINVNGLFYIFNSKYYFIYTTGETDENEYVKLYVVQVCKEIQNTPTGPVDTGYMLGMEISNPEEWGKVQESITKIVEDKKNGTQSSDIQYLPINMLVNLKITSKNKFKLMRHIVENDFNVTISVAVSETIHDNEYIGSNTILENNIEISPIKPMEPINILQEDNAIGQDTIENIQNTGEVIIDYRSRFFEEQEKNQELEAQIKKLNEKLENIKNIIG